jgi:hypothetical protein
MFVLTATNIAYAVATFCQGFGENPELTLTEFVTFPLFFTRPQQISSALLVLYLLSLSSVALWFAFVRYHRFHHASTVVKIIVIAQAYLIIALAFAVLITAPSFGSAPLCNVEVLVVFFGTIRFLNVGRVVFLVFVSLIAILWTASRIQTYLGRLGEKHSLPTQAARCAPPSGDTTLGTRSAPHLSPDHNLIFKIVLVIILSLCAIVNTELLMSRNHVRIDAKPWGLGQVRCCRTLQPLNSTAHVSL